MKQNLQKEKERRVWGNIVFYMVSFLIYHNQYYLKQLKNSIKRQ